MKAIIAVPATVALVYRAWSHKSLTPAGIIVAALTAIVHAIHPWNLPFVLLVVFFLAGTKVTKVKKDIKEKLTVQSTGSSGGEGPRTHIQVLANSGVASVLTLLHSYQLHQLYQSPSQESCFAWGEDLLIIGIIANYAAVAADTFSSELGILSKSQPRLITSITLRKVPKGTNGGVTLWGLVAGLLGSFVIVITAMLSISFCSTQPGRIARLGVDQSGGDMWGWVEKGYFALALIVWGALGSVLDSVLGGFLQQSVVETRSGRVVEGEGGARVLVSKVSTGSHKMHYKKRSSIEVIISNEDDNDTVPQRTMVDELDEPTNDGYDRYDPKKKHRTPSFGDGKPSRLVVSGFSLLDNNEVNFLMALIISVGAMAIAGWVWDVPLHSILPKF